LIFVKLVCEEGKHSPLSIALGNIPANLWGSK
jgi:hypothetical protein